MIMRITCDYCGAVFDSENNAVCPRCMSPYGDDVDKKNIEDYEQKKRRLDIEHEKEDLEAKRNRNELLKEELQRNRMRNEHQRKVERVTGKLSKGVSILIIGISILVFLAIVIGFVLAVKNETKPKTGTLVSETPEVTEIPIKKAEGKVGKELNTGRYTVVVDEIRKIDYYPWTGKKDHTCILIHMTLTNHLDKTLSSDIYQHVIADGIAQEFFILPTGYKKLPTSVPAGLTVEGWARVEIPNKAKKMEFQFGDYVVCNFTWNDVIIEDPAE